MKVGTCQAKFPAVDDNRRPIRKCFRIVDLAAMDLVWFFPEQGAFTRTKVLRTISDYLGWDGGPSDEIVVPETGGYFCRI